MPLPMPRWVMSSASHMTTAVPAVNTRMMKSTLRGGEVRDEVDVCCHCRTARPQWNKKTRPELCMTARATVR